MFIICTLLPYVCLPFLCCVKFCSGCFRQFFFIWKTKKWSLVALDMLSSYAVTTEWKFARADSALVVLDKWSSYKGDHLNRFYCMFSCSMYYCDSSYIKPFLTTIPTQLGANLSFFFFWPIVGYISLFPESCSNFSHESLHKYSCYYSDKVKNVGHAALSLWLFFCILGPISGC